MIYEENLTHIFSFDGDHILLDVNSGAVHQLSDLAYQAVCLWRESGCELKDLPDMLTDWQGPTADSQGAGGQGAGGQGAGGQGAGGQGAGGQGAGGQGVGGQGVSWQVTGGQIAGGQGAGSGACGDSPARLAGKGKSLAASDTAEGLLPDTGARDQSPVAMDIADAREICEGLADLAEEGLLMSRALELESYQPPEGYVVKALCLHVAHDCNLRCRYCFAGTGAFGGDRSLMSFETGKKALDFLFDSSGSRGHVEVDYFGGEPLMNFPVVKELILYGEEESRRRGKVLKQTLTTNGVLLEGAVLDFLDQHEIALVLSLDGRQEINDKMRPFANGQGSYDVILPHFRAAVDRRGGDNYYLRGTYTRFNRDFFSDVRHMVESGFGLVSVEPVVASPEEEYAFREEDLPVLFAQYEELARYHVDKTKADEPFLFFHYNLDLDRGPCLPKRLSGCGAGYEYLAVSPEGNLYPCHQFVGREDFALGNVGAGVMKPEIGERFRQSHVLTKETCRDCWARFYCSGGCHANAWNFNRDLKKPYVLGCELEKKRLECAIWIKVMEHSEEG